MTSIGSWNPDLNMSNQLRVAVFGAGHMGRHHARIYSELPDVELVGIVDTDPTRAAELASKYGTHPVASGGELIGKIDAASVAVPTVYHAEVSKPLLEAGIALLIEKPLAPDSTVGRKLVEWAREHNCVLAVGHSERFNPIVQAMNRMEIKPKFIDAQRVSPFRFRSADIGVVFDLMIHDIDIVLHLVRSRNYEVRAVGVNVLGEHEDIANARVEFDNGAVANLTASRLALKTDRRIRVFSPEAYLSMDFQRRSGIAVKKDKNLDILQMARERDLSDLSEMQNVDFGSMINVEPLEVDDVEPLRAEIESFLHSVRTSQTPEVSAEDGLAAVELAEAIVKAVRRHQWDRE